MLYSRRIKSKRFSAEDVNLIMINYPSYPF